MCLKEDDREKRKEKREGGGGRRWKGGVEGITKEEGKK